MYPNYFFLNTLSTKVVFPDFIFLHSLDNFRLLKRESGNIESQKIFFMSQNVTLGGGGGGKE